MKLNEKRVVNDIRLLALDMINKAGSGHPGIALGAAPILYTLFTYHLKVDLERKNWCNRDRFVMSAGHGSALLYASLFAIYEDYSIDDLKSFRTLNSRCTGHPEYNLNNRIEATTGPLGQGLAMAVGMAIAEKNLEASFNRKKNTIFDYNIYALCSDGDLMEGISYEAASLAGTLGLDNLIVLYDANNVSLDGPLDRSFTESVIDRFTSMNWDVIHVKNGESIKDINNAIEKAKRNKKPTLIGINTIIGINSKYEGTSKIHSTLEASDLEDIRLKLKGMGSFCYDKENITLLRNYVKGRCASYYSNWYNEYGIYLANSTDKEKDDLNYFVENEDITLKIDKVIDESKIFVDKSMRDINYQVMNVITTFVPNFMGGSADLVSSTKTYLKNKGDFGIDNYLGKNIFFGVREHAMAGILNGLALSNYRSFGSTFLAFSDYMKPSIRLSAMMDLPVTYIFTHDSILVGSDGPTHQPIEQIGSLRSIPNLSVYRPCDYKELIGAWNLILSSRKPSALVLPRNHVETIDDTNVDKVKYGAYIVSEVKTRLDLILIATGSEVELAMKIKEELLKNYIEARVVSMPNLNLFLSQDREYIDQVLPKRYKKIVIEFSNDPNWYRFVSDKEDIIGIEDFGKSATSKDILDDLDMDLTNIIIKIKNRL